MTKPFLVMYSQILIFFLILFLCSLPLIIGFSFLIQFFFETYASRNKTYQEPHLRIEIRQQEVNSLRLSVISISSGFVEIRQRSKEQQSKFRLFVALSTAMVATGAYFLGQLVDHIAVGWLLALAGGYSALTVLCGTVVLVRGGLFYERSYQIGIFLFLSWMISALIVGESLPGDVRWLTGLVLITLSQLFLYREVKEG